MAQGLKLSNGSNISGFSSPVQPDRGFTRETTPNVIRAVFGDGYEQRKVLGINNNKEVFNCTFNNRPNTETDDLEAFLRSTNGVTNFIFTIPDSNEGSGELDIKVVCDKWTKIHTHTGATGLNVQLRRVYES